MVLSNQLSITVAGASPAIIISASATSFPASGGTLTVTGTSNEPGKTVYLFYNSQNTMSTTTDSHGDFSFTMTIPANSAASPVTDTVYVSDNSSGT